MPNSNVSLNDCTISKRYKTQEIFDYHQQTHHFRKSLPIRPTNSANIPSSSQTVWTKAADCTYCCPCCSCHIRHWRSLGVRQWLWLMWYLQQPLQASLSLPMLSLSKKLPIAFWHGKSGCHLCSQTAQCPQFLTQLQLHKSAILDIIRSVHTTLLLNFDWNPWQQYGQWALAISYNPIHWNTRCEHGSWDESQRRVEFSINLIVNSTIKGVWTT